MAIRNFSEKTLTAEVLKRVGKAPNARPSSSPAHSSLLWRRHFPPANSVVSRRLTPITVTPDPIGPRSSTRKAAEACPIWACTT